LTLLFGCERKPPEAMSHKGRQVVPTHAVTFVPDDGSESVSIRVQVAQTDAERNLGLMDVRQLAPDHGMMFLFEEQAPLSFWMANTPLSLDMIFIDESWRIVRIHADTRPFSLDSYSSGTPARYVVEVNAGFCRRHDIREGQTIRFHDILP
jgi:uncharacterized membrane protein (UPF0127 family)